MNQRPQPISDRIAAWKQAFDAVLAEIAAVRGITPEAWTDAARAAARTSDLELAARTAATLAIGATTRERETE